MCPRLRVSALLEIDSFTDATWWEERRSSEVWKVPHQYSVTWLFTFHSMWWQQCMNMSLSLATNGVCDSTSYCTTLQFVSNFYLKTVVMNILSAIFGSCFMFIFVYLRRSWISSIGTGKVEGLEELYNNYNSSTALHVWPTMYDW